MRLILLSLLLSSLACASAPPLIPVDWSAPMSDTNPTPAECVEARRKCPDVGGCFHICPDGWATAGAGRAACLDCLRACNVKGRCPRAKADAAEDRTDATKPQPVDPTPHSVSDNKCAAESKACLDCSMRCAATKGCKPEACVAVCAKVDECMARPRK